LRNALSLVLLALCTAGCARPGFRAQPPDISPEAVVLDVPAVQQEARDECGLATMSALLGVRVDPVAEPEAAIKGADIVMCASNSIDHIFFERWIEPGMHLSSIKRPEIEVKAIKRADRVIIHWNDPAPIHVAAKGVVIEEKVEGRGWQLAEEIDFKQLATLPELVIGRVDGRKSDADVTCFINNIGLGFQFAAAGALVYRKAKESGLGHEVPTDWFTEDVHP